MSDGVEDDPLGRALAALRGGEMLRDPRADGRGVKVALIDTGVDRSRLAARARERGADIADPVCAAFRADAADVVSNPPRPSSPHGTTVADILLTHAPAIHLHSADVFGPTGLGDVRVLVRAIRHAMDAWGCQVVNLSLGIPESALLPQRRIELYRVIEEAYFRDVHVVAAVHNEHPHVRSFPALFGAPLISVDRAELFEYPHFSHHGQEQAEFKAHGRGYTGLFAADAATSWAAPHLTAMVARLLSLRPGLKPFEVKALLYWMGRGEG